MSSDLAAVKKVNVTSVVHIINVRCGTGEGNRLILSLERGMFTSKTKY